jgi:GrpB-like predicted nucleotidyltransferase (UPF0157 family)
MTWAAKYPDRRLVDYDPAWRELYIDLERGLTAALGTDWVIEHAGSTSVPGMCAKPVIDVVLRLPETWGVVSATESLTEAGWSAPIVVGDHWATFHPSIGRREAIGHIFTAGQWPEAHVRLFADWLRRHAEDRQRYVALKQGLLADGVWDASYTVGKAEFVRDIVNRARTERGLPPVAGVL